MKTTLSIDDLMGYTESQLNHFFPDGIKADLRARRADFDVAMDRLDFCFSKVVSPRYGTGVETSLNHLYADHYIVYLWFLANSLWRSGADSNLVNKLYYLNKALHAFDCMYDTALPDVFLIIHGAGTVLGKASYGEYFVAHQGCTVGINDGAYPVIGNRVALGANSSVIGSSMLGDGVSVGNFANVFEAQVPDGHHVYRSRYGELMIKPTAKKLSDFYFR